MGLARENARMRTSNRRSWSIGSADSVLSIGSKGSILSIGSAGSILSIGSAGSVLSIGSAGSVASAFSAASVMSVGSMLSAFSRWSILTWRAGFCRNRADNGRHEQPQYRFEPVTPWQAGDLEQEDVIGWARARGGTSAEPFWPAKRTRQRQRSGSYLNES